MKEEDRKPDIDLGDEHALRFYRWAPDRGINPQYEGIPDVERYGAIVYHKKKDGSECWSGVTFESEVAKKIGDDRPSWKVESWEPLTLSPSLLCRLCGDHGFIRNGKWERA